MILQEIGRYLEARGRAGLKDIALHVDAEESAVRGMLEHWVRKGRVYRFPVTTSCGSTCGTCGSQESDLFVWRGGIKAQPLPFPRLPRG